jgi:hypothetical protein
MQWLRIWNSCKIAVRQAGGVFKSSFGRANALGERDLPALSNRLAIQHF